MFDAAGLEFADEIGRQRQVLARGCVDVAIGCDDARTVGLVEAAGIEIGVDLVIVAKRGAEDAFPTVRELLRDTRTQQVRG